MTVFHGKDGVVSIGANAVAEVRSFELVVSSEFVPAPGMGDTNIKKVAGQGDVEGSVTCWYDPADTAGQGGIQNGLLVALKLQPQGVGSGLPEIDIADAGVSNVTRGQDVGGVAEFTFSFTGTSKDPPTFGTQT